MPRLRDDDVYEQLKHDITYFRVAPGERLVESELSDRYGTSRTPVREALRRLEQEGLVVAMAGGRVARHFDLRDFEDMYRVRMLVEQLSVEQACERAGSRAIANLRDSWELPEGREDPAQRALACEARLHLGIAELSQNQMLISVLGRINDRIAVLRATDFLAPGRIEAVRDEHNMILDAIAEREPDKAMRLMEHHISEAKENIAHLISNAMSEARSADEREAAARPAKRRSGR